MKKTFASIALILILLLSVTAFFACEEAVLPAADESAGALPQESDVSLTESGDGDNASASESGADESLPPTQTESGEETLSPDDGTSETYRYIAPTDDTEIYLAACASANVNVRRGAGTDYGVLSTLGIGDSLPYLWQEGDWIAVWTGERVGYLSAAYAYVTETNLGIERTIRAGLAKLGTPYEWGATRRITGSGLLNPFFTGKSFDCSSFVQYCYYIGMGIKLGNYTGSQADYTVGGKITRYEDLKRGDFYFTGTDGTISHVVIYLGGGKLLQAYSANGGPVSVTAEDRWKRNFISGRRPDPTVIEQFR